MGFPSKEQGAGGSGVLGSAWTQGALTAQTLNLDGSGDIKASAAGSNEIAAYRNENTFNPDQYAKAIIRGGLASGTNYAEVWVRASGSNTTLNGYSFFTDGVTGTGHTAIDKWTNGVGAEIAPIATTFATGDEMKIQIVGPLITVYKNGAVVGSFSDSSFATGAPGMAVFNSGTNNVVVQSFEGGNVAQADTVATRRVGNQPGPFDRLGFLARTAYDSTSVSTIAAVTGTGAMLVAAFALAGTCGQESDASSALLAIAPPVYAATSTQTESGTGAVAVQSPTFNGTVSQTISGTGSLAIPVFVFSGTSTQAESGTGSLAVPAPAFSGTSSQAETGTGSLAIASPVFSGTSSQSVTGTGSLAAPLVAFEFGDNINLPTPSFSGTGTTTSGSGNSGTGSIALVAFSYSGTSSQSESGSGSLAIGSPSFSGSGLAGVIGSGALDIGTPQFSGSGTTLDGTVSGSGDMQVSISMSGLGTVPPDNTLPISPFGYIVHKKHWPETKVVIEQSFEIEEVTQKWVSLVEFRIEAQLDTPQMSGVGTVSVPEVAILDAGYDTRRDKPVAEVAASTNRASLRLTPKDAGSIPATASPSDTPPFSQIAPENAPDAHVPVVTPPQTQSPEIASYAVASVSGSGSTSFSIGMHGVGSVVSVPVSVKRTTQEDDDDMVLIVAMLMEMT